MGLEPTLGGVPVNHSVDHTFSQVFCMALALLALSGGSLGHFAL